MTAYYNENDKGAAAWLRELIKEGHIEEGEVDDRSIQEVQPEDLKGFNRAHFFAGIGGWAYALRLSDLEHVEGLWTGSCPCQPFSSAGRGRGTADDRHLWPEFWRLIEAGQPKLVFGEQVAGGKGLKWFDLVCDDLERGNYAPGAAIVPACSVGAPHKRERLWWSAKGLDYAHCHGLEARKFSFLEKKARHRAPKGRETEPGGRSSGLGAWAGAILEKGRGGERRYVKPGIFPLAHGIPARVVRLRGYGNAIVPQVAAEFMIATLANGGTHDR